MKNHTICTKCIMDTSDADIYFDEAGVCNYCKRYSKLKNVEYSKSEKEFQSLITRIKNRGKTYPYDCIVGISGGTDSSFMLHKLKDEGLRILAVHYNSGWNSAEANHNVEVLTKKLGVDFKEYTIDFEEFRALQIAYLKAGVVDMDVPTDHALHGILYKAAAENKAPFILTGHNFETESVMPVSWVTDKLDSKNMLDIYKKFGDGTRLKTFPIQTSWRKFVNYNIRKIEMIFILNYLDYNKENASREMKVMYGWDPVRVKHGESIWTRFYQCYILPSKFDVDKRKAHFSNLILSGVMTREEALQELEQPAYKDDLERDKNEILEKYRITPEEFDEWMSAPNRQHSDFKNEKDLKKLYAKLRTFIPGLKISTRH